MKLWHFEAIISVILPFSGCASTLDLPIGQQSPQTFEKKITKKIRVDYLLYLPQGYAERNDKWPLILFLHGAGERGRDLDLVKTHGPPKLVEEGRDFPFIIVSPQCSQDQQWSTEYLDPLLKEIVRRYRVNEDRIYVTGLSMGGYGAWALALEYPNRFAAIAPICGGADPVWAGSIIHLPIWVFHGAKDKVVPIERSQAMVDALKKLAGNVKFTIYPEAGHDSWTEAYNNQQLYDWFLQQRR